MHKQTGGMTVIPQEILQLLESEKFCFLATTYQDAPHISLMNFTYLAADETIILSSRADTTKVSNLRSNPAAAVLLCRFGREYPPISCTLYGTATVLPPGQDQPYRDLHLARHQDMASFILGEHIAIITVRLTSASLSDRQDHVRLWAAPTHDS
jgi:hypothetical protein